MTGMISVNVKKIKATAKVNGLIEENYREEENAKRYENGRRKIDISKTGENVFLLERPTDYDRHRQERIERVNEARAGRIDPKLHMRKAKAKMKEEGTLQAAASREAASRRKLRADTVDTLGIVVQPSADFINGLSREQQTKFFRDSLEAMQKHPEWFGKIETATIHYDENTPHMQCLASTINEETLTSDCQKIMGNRKRMSDRQTLLAEEMKKRGWDVERGINRVSDPEYKNFKSEMEAQGYRVTRFNDAKLMKEHEALKQGKEALESEKNEFRQEKFDFDLEKSDQLIKGMELDNRATELDERALALQQLGAETERKRQSLESRDRRQDTRDLTQDNRQREQDKRETSLNAKEEELQKQADEIGAKNRESVKTRTRALQKLQEQQKEKEELERLKAELEQREKDVSEREEKASSKEQSLNSLETSLNARKDDLDKQEEDLTVREEKFEDDRKKGLERFKDMAYDIKQRTDNELENRRDALEDFDDMDDFDDMVKQLDSLQTMEGQMIM